MEADDKIVFDVPFDENSLLAADPAELARRLNLQRAPGYLIRRLDSRAAALYETSTGQSTLTTRQFGLLEVVFQCGVVRQSELANRLHLDRSTLGEMIQRMADRKLLTRRTLPDDRRTSEIELTPFGEATLLENVRGAIQAQVEFLAPLPAFLRPAFMKCLEILTETDGSAVPPPDDLLPASLTTRQGVPRT